MLTVLIPSVLFLESLVLMPWVFEVMFCAEKNENWLYLLIHFQLTE